MRGELHVVGIVDSAKVIDLTIRMLACPESCVFLDSHSTIPGKSLGLPTDDLVALLAGDRPLSVDAGHRASSSSDEDNDIGSVDISLTETDHPLHDTELLGTLLYTEQLKVRGTWEGGGGQGQGKGRVTFLELCATQSLPHAVHVATQHTPPHSSSCACMCEAYLTFTHTHT